MARCDFFFIPQNMVTFAVFLCSLGVGEGAESFDDPGLVSCVFTGVAENF
jgi:hypothetical protein